MKSRGDGQGRGEPKRIRKGTGAAAAGIGGESRTAVQAEVGDAPPSAAAQGTGVEVRAAAEGRSPTHHPPHADLGQWRFPPIGYVRSPFKEKFGIPRQPGLAAGDAVLKLNSDPLLRNAVRELESFTHLWVIFVFHAHDARSWKPSIRPPRLGGARKVGVLASRSPHRPNPIGLSAVRLVRVDAEAPGGVELHLAGVDLLDGTPVLDVKPYLPYADRLEDAGAGWAAEPIARHAVEFEAEAEREIARRARARGDATPDALREEIRGLLELDPRPAFQKRRLPPGSAEAEGTRYGFRLHDFDVRWEIRGGAFRVLELADGPPPGSGRRRERAPR
jgi:tRNA-Thr(GGU) m(6)t(6)A37 methyltransferase TsaA